jgi:LuxR family transcriptional regulator, maltose regulon positive regulatory protein
LLLAQAQVTATSGHLDEVEPLLEAAERVAASGAEEPFEPTVGRAGSLLVNIPAHIALHRSYLAQFRGDAEGTAAFARQALAELHPGEWMLNSTIQGFLAVAAWLRGQLAEAERAFVSSLAGWQATDQLTVTVWAAYSLAQVQRSRGRLDAAVQTSQRALDVIGVPGRRAQPAAGLGHISLAEVAYQRDELDSALRHVSEGIPLCRQWVYLLPLASGLVTLAWVRQSTGDPAGGMAAMSEAGQVAPGAAGLLNPVPAQRARLLLAQGELGAAARWADESGLEPADEPRYPDEPGHLVLARILLAQDDPGRALSLLDRLHAAAAAQGRTGSVIEVGALRSLALAAAGADDEAVAALAGTLTLACPQGFVRVFADEGPRMAGLLGRLIAAQRDGHAAAEVPLGCLARLWRAFAAGHDAGGSGPAAAVPGIIEPLTTRELQVLAMLAGGRPNQAIAAELVVTLDTVKKHVSHVLGKLGAANRTEAVARGRELGLIP